MKPITFLLLAGFLGTETFAATDTESAAPSVASIVPSSSHDAIFGASKRKKRKKSRPAYRRIGSYLGQEARQVTA